MNAIAASFSRLLDIIAAHQPTSGPIAVLGLSYKPDTAVIEQSQGVALVDRLCAHGHRVLAYDPKALDATRAAVHTPLSSSVRFTATPVTAMSISVRGVKRR